MFVWKGPRSVWSNQEELVDRHLRQTTFHYVRNNLILQQMFNSFPSLVKPKINLGVFLVWKITNIGNNHVCLFIFSDLLFGNNQFRFSLNFILPHDMFRHQALITCKQLLKVLDQVPFSQIDESESCAKIDIEIMVKRTINLGNIYCEWVSYNLLLSLPTICFTA